ncbi:MAG: CRISPR-associated endonuclease Cas3'' [bacterium]
MFFGKNKGWNMPDKKYYAHSLKDKPKSEWQTLEGHLKNVAELARQFTESFNAGELGYLAGLLHDVGKYQPEFQRYLVEGGKRGSVPHAVWGAGYARILGMNEIPFAIDGHHKGLPNKSDLKKKIQKNSKGKMWLNLIQLLSLLSKIPLFLKIILNLCHYHIQTH